MRRRKFIGVLGGAAAWSVAAHAQQPNRMLRIGILVGLAKTNSEGQRWVRRFIQALRDLGWRNGTNVQIDLRWAGDSSSMRAEAQELIASQPDLIQVMTGLATAAVLQQTRTIPVVFSVVNDPAAAGFVQNLERPEGNATGFTNIDPSLGARWLELLKEIAPTTTRAAVLFTPSTERQMGKRWDALQAAAAPLGITIDATPFQNTADLEPAIAELGRDPQAGLIVIPEFSTMFNEVQITAIVARHRVIAIYPTVDFVKAGGLVSLAVDLPDLQRRAAAYVDRILKGATPADLPVLPPDKFELFINVKTAKALGLTMPPALMARAQAVE